MFAGQLANNDWLQVIMWLQSTLSLVVGYIQGAACRTDALKQMEKV